MVSDVYAWASTVASNGKSRRSARAVRGGPPGERNIIPLGILAWARKPGYPWSHKSEHDKRLFHLSFFVPRCAGSEAACVISQLGMGPMPLRGSIGRPCCLGSSARAIFMNNLHKLSHDILSCDDGGRFFLPPVNVSKRQIQLCKAKERLGGSKQLLSREKRAPRNIIC